MLPLHHCPSRDNEGIISVFSPLVKQKKTARIPGFCRNSARTAGKREGAADVLKAYIWDLDGTLLDSYEAIVSSLVAVARETGAADTFDEIMSAVKRGAVSAYLRDLAARFGRDYDGLYRRYREISHEKLRDITLIPGAAETLEALRSAGAAHFVYTHRGASTAQVLRRLGLTEYFTEIVTFEYGFPPKPSGAGVEYLVEKYGLEKESTAYVGDRTIDVLCAKDAGVKAVLYCTEDSPVRPTGEEDRVIRHLRELTE